MIFACLFHLNELNIAQKLAEIPLLQGRPKYHIGKKKKIKIGK